MLLSLRIQNLALVEDFSINFNKGFTVFTGETGAGKSLLVDAISLLIGTRGDANIVRHGYDKAVVEAVIDGDYEAWDKFLYERGLPKEQPVILRREVAISGRSRAWLNGGACSLNDLREASRIWVRLTGQHDYQSLMAEDRHLALLDETIGIKINLSAEVEQVKSAQARMIAKSLSESKIKERLEWLHQEITTLSKLAPKKGEWSQLYLEREPLRHAAQLEQIFCESVEDLGHSSYYADLSYRALTRAAIILPCISGDVDRLRSVMLELDDILSLAREQVASWSNKGVNYIESLEARMAEFERLARRHNCEPDELYYKLSELKHEQEELLAGNSDIEVLMQILVKACENYYLAAEKLHQIRVDFIPKLEKEVNKRLTQLGITSARLQIRLGITEDTSSPAVYLGHPIKISPNGFSSASFLIETNIGEGFRPLTKVASGGELSRLMLAIQGAGIALGTERNYPLVLVFDEVDTGIGGETAIAVGAAISELSGYHQVLLVTHLAQVAVKADNHGFLCKSIKENRTHSNFTWLFEDSKVRELARLLSGHTDNSEALSHAKSLLLSVR